jgi:hypothetical protein
MQSHLGPIDIVCDAPPYSIIQACNRIGIQRPEDVRWCRMSHYLSGEDGRKDSLHFAPWKTMFSATSKASRLNCACGHALPILEKCTFTFITGREASYFIGQCKRCLRIYWDETT